jgi:murein DD-endopeptidase MepM/ murein hydrolase activator NlpD
MPADAPISASWNDHRVRTPPSSEPGTDIACAYGTTLVAVGAGRIADLSHSNGTGTGRFVTIDLDDGYRTRSLHMAEVWVSVGDRVTAGQEIGLSGGSGQGSDTYYGAHVHQTLWTTQKYTFGPDSTVDFMLYVGSSATTTPEDDMAFPMCFEPNTLIWPNGYASSYDVQVYQAIRDYVRDPFNPSAQWVRDTFVRESWVAANYMQDRLIQAQLGAVADAIAGRRRHHPPTNPDDPGDDND